MDEKEHILIVDDDESTRQSLSLILKKKGYETQAVGTGREALEIAQTEPLDLALLDIMLPDMEGVELLAPLKEMQHDIVIIMVTAHASLETAMRALNEGASAYTTKPLDMDKVLATIGEALEKQHLLRENRRLYEAVQLSKERYALATRAAQVGVWDWDAQSGAFYLDPNLKALLGYSDAEIPNDLETWTSYVHPADRQAVIDAGRAHIDGQTPEYVCEHRMLHKDGSVRWMLVHGRAMRDEQGNVTRMIGTNTDVTQRVQADRERANLIEELETKNAELERFTYTVSHDLKSPLITIQGFLGLLLQDVVKGEVEQIRHDVSRISGAVKKMEQLLNELLELSRVGRVVNPPQEVSLGELVQEAVDIVAGQLDDSGVLVEITPELLPSGNGLTVYGDRPRLLEVLQNLVDNAIKYMGDQPKPRVEIGTRRDGDRTIIYVRDNGVGIDPRYHEQIFGLFNKLDHESEGVGVGLTIVKRIVEVHGGRVWVESAGEGHGSTFCFTLNSK